MVLNVIPHRWHSNPSLFSLPGSRNTADAPARCLTGSQFFRRSPQLTSPPLVLLSCQADTDTHLTCTVNCVPSFSSLLNSPHCHTRSADSQSVRRICCSIWLESSTCCPHGFLSHLLQVCSQPLLTLLLSRKSRLCSCPSPLTSSYISLMLLLLVFIISFFQKSWKLSKGKNFNHIYSLLYCQDVVCGPEPRRALVST